MTDGPPLPGWPRGLREELAAAYVGLGASTFRAQVDAGEAPKPVRLTARRQVWLRDDLDRWLDRKAGSAASGFVQSAAEAGAEWMEALGHGAG